MNKKLLSCLGLSFVMGVSLCAPTKAASTISAGKAFKIRYANKTYTKKAINMRYNNSIIKSNTPGYICGSTSMYSAYWHFKRCSSLKVSYSYSKKTKKITMKRGSNTIVMKVNSRSASLNGKSFKLPAAARSVYIYNKKKSYIMVPGYTVATKLGLKYTWNNRLLSGMVTMPQSTSSTTAQAPATTATTSVGPTTKIVASASNYSIRIRKPSGLSSSRISCSDDYGNRRLRLIISGNYKSHFSSSANRNIINSLSYSTSYSGGNTYVNLKTSTIKGFSVKQDSNYIYVKYASPRSMFKRVIVVDAGHGGSDSGAVGNGFYEKTLTLRIVTAMKGYFDNNSNYKVYYTRLSDWYPSLSYRYKLANEVNAHRFLSVHINSGSSSAKGTETLYKTYKDYGQKIQTQALVGMGYSTSKPYNRGLKYRSDLAVLNGPKMTTALAEMGFISNKTEVKRINSRIKTIGYNMYRGIGNSF